MTMSNDTRRIGTGLLVQWGILVLTGGVAWGTLRAAQLNLESRVSKTELAISTMIEQRSHIEVLIGRLDEKLIAIQRQLSMHMKDKDYEP